MIRISKLTKEVFQSEKYELNQKLLKVEQEIRLLEAEYIEENKRFSRLQKVRIKTSKDSEPKTAFICKAYVGLNSEIYYTFYSATENGTCTYFEISSYDYEIVE